MQGQCTKITKELYESLLGLLAHYQKQIIKKYKFLYLLNVKAFVAWLFILCILFVWSLDIQRTLINLTFLMAGPGARLQRSIMKVIQLSFLDLYSKSFNYLVIFQ